jgi:hypothetical protein
MGQSTGTRNHHLVPRLEMLEAMLPLPHLRGVVINWFLIKHRNKFALLYVRGHTCVCVCVRACVVVCR